MSVLGNLSGCRSHTGREKCHNARGCTSPIRIHSKTETNGQNHQACCLLRVSRTHYATWPVDSTIKGRMYSISRTRRKPILELYQFFRNISPTFHGDASSSRRSLPTGKPLCKRQISRSPRQITQGAKQQEAGAEGRYYMRGCAD